MTTTLTESQKLSIIDKYDRNPEQVLNMLLDLQYASPENYIDQQTAKLVARAIGVTETRVYEQISFYALLHETPQARYTFLVCDSTPCHFSDEHKVADTLAQKLGIVAGEQTPDKLFSYELTPCYGMCDKIPFVKIKNQVFENMTDEGLDNLISDLKAGKYESTL
ncbi:MAG: NAD(P)H-dependent oxidoreductase subunit E [Streptococcaceae bacterium]|jgi:NADH-quinone oxidoreductase subunit E|nr:NAD(P)H-dependent oxidoreductase subunit E [Streptococcaceae bacterium]